jgi:hypothetical protein
VAIECERWEWRELFASEHGPKDAGTRLVLFVLALHMNQAGGSCFPSQKTIAERSGLSERSVRTHLTNAEKAGWLKIGQQSQKGQAWFVHNYVATFPDELADYYATKPWEDDPRWNDEHPAKSAGRKHKGKPQQAANSAGCHRAEVVEPNVQRAANSSERAAILTERAANSSATPGKFCSNARQGLPTNSPSNTPYNSPINTPIERAVASDRTGVVGNGTVRVSIKNLPKEQRIRLAQIGLAKGMNPEDIQPQYDVTVDEVAQESLKHGT